MAIRMIRLNEDPVLRQVAKPVPEVTKVIQKLIDDMAETMYDAEGIGLAAPQVGVPKRVIVMDIQSEEESGLIALVNPEIIEKSGESRGWEGCLSLPGLSGEVTRPSKVRVRGLDREGQPVEFEAAGMLARCVQHEIDHLDGIMFTDYLKPSEIVRNGAREKK